MKKIYILIFISIINFAYAETNIYLGSKRDAWPEKENVKTKNNFGGWLLVTSDLNWQSKWETQPDTIPLFNEEKNVKVGEDIVILTFFTNPKINNKNEAFVLCDIKVTRPNNTISVNYKDFACFKGLLKGNPEYLRISPAILNFNGSPTDPLGEWEIEVKVHDVIRDTVLNLNNSFILESNMANKKFNMDSGADAPSPVN